MLKRLGVIEMEEGAQLFIHDVRITGTDHAGSKPVEQLEAVRRKEWARIKGLGNERLVEYPRMFHGDCTDHKVGMRNRPTRARQPRQTYINAGGAAPSCRAVSTRVQLESTMVQPETVV